MTDTANPPTKPGLYAKSTYTQCPNPACQAPATQTTIILPPCGHAFCAQCPSVDHYKCDECRTSFAKSTVFLHKTALDSHAECGLCQLVCAKQAVRLGCGHSFCSLCLTNSGTQTCPTCSCPIEQSQNQPFQGASSGRRFVVSGKELMSVSQGVFPARVLPKYSELPLPSSPQPALPPSQYPVSSSGPSPSSSPNASSRRAGGYVIVALPHLLDVRASSNPSDWDVSAEPTLVKLLAKFKQTPLDVAAEEVGHITAVVEHYRAQLADKLLALQLQLQPQRQQPKQQQEHQQHTQAPGDTKLDQPQAAPQAPVQVQRPAEHKQRERKVAEPAVGAAWLERLVPDPPAEYKGDCCAVRVTVSVLGGALQTEHLLGDHKDPNRVRVSLTVGVGVCRQYVQHVRVLGDQAAEAQGASDDNGTKALATASAKRLQVALGPTHAPCPGPSCGTATGSVHLTLHPHVGYRSLQGQLIVQNPALGGAIFTEYTNASSSPAKALSSSSAASSSSGDTVCFALRDSTVVCEHMGGPPLRVVIERPPTAASWHCSSQATTLAAGGGGDGQVWNPRGVATLAISSGQRLVVVADCGNQRVQMWGADSGQLVRSWPLPGGGYPVAIACWDGHVIVVNIDMHRIMVCNAMGQLVRQWGSKGNGQEQFDDPWGVAVAPARSSADNSNNDAEVSPHVYVADSGNDRVSVFTVQGEWVRNIGSKDAPDDAGRLAYPQGVAVHGDELLVSSSGTHRVVIFDRHTGQFRRQWGKGFAVHCDLSYPSGLAVHSGAVWVCDNGNKRVLVLDLQGALVGSIATDGSPWFVCVTRTSAGSPSGQPNQADESTADWLQVLITERPHAVVLYRVGW